MSRNEELFRKVADAIEREPESYDQGWFFRDLGCGTTACIAGWAVALAKHQGNLSAACRSYPDAVNEWMLLEPESIPATALLGLTTDDASYLFGQGWRPHDGLSVPDALRKIGEGAAIEDVSA